MRAPFLISREPAENGQTDLNRAERARLFTSALGRTTSACTADVRIGTQ
jgi:hypothetical protein